ncbi:TPA: hypothetical protein OMT71_000716 [Klebsiella aerogenes]|nr:hypothetical protein [Klebsiella aerogenes]
MNVYEMEGFLRGKCLPGDIRVNESNAEYLVRKLRAVCELQGEVTALAATLEKCREVSGCPVGVDLQDWVKMLVSELSVVEEIHNSAVFITDELYDASPKEVQGIIRSLACMKMPAYARLIAGIKADGVEEWVSSRGGRWNGTTEEALKFAKQLREGAGK